MTAPLAAVLLGPSVYDRARMLEVRLGPSALRLHTAATGDARLAALLESADVAITGIWSRDLPPAPRLRLVQVSGAGLEGIDRGALPPTAALCNAFGHEAPVAEHVVLGLLQAAHRLADADRAFRQGSWGASPYGGGERHGELAGRTIVIVGLGRVGQAVAARLRPFGTRVIGVNRSPRPAPDGVDAVVGLGDLDGVLPAADALVLCCALAPATRGLIGADRLARLPRHAVLVNVARGPVADEAALYAALQDGTIGSAVLDAWYRYPDADDPAPRPSRHPFHTLPNVIMTPQSAAWTQGMIDRRWDEIAENLRRLRNGRPFINLVQPALRARADPS